ncbi:MAG TPA: post-transcriptional regulator [Ureibacillus sp.]|nr:post-transcriptional regulator [Ureibacillus sp.]
MMMTHPDLFKKVLPAIQSKLEEFQHFGYEHITQEDVWNYCVNKKWRKKIIEDLKLHEVVETIFSISASEIVSFTQIKSFQRNDWFEELNKEELAELFRKEPKKG